MFCVLIVIFITLQTSTESALDSITLNILIDPEKYGKYRFWFGVGWGSTSALLGLIFDFISITTMFYFFAGFMGLLALIWFIALFIDTFTSFKILSCINTRKTTDRIAFDTKLYLFFKQITWLKLEILFAFIVDHIRVKNLPWLLQRN